MLKPQSCESVGRVPNILRVFFEPQFTNFSIDVFCKFSLEIPADIFTIREPQDREIREILFGSGTSCDGF